MGTELFPETSGNIHILTRLYATSTPWIWGRSYFLKRRETFTSWRGCLPENICSFNFFVAKASRRSRFAHSGWWREGKVVVLRQEMCVFLSSNIILQEYVHCALVGGQIVENFDWWYHFVFEMLVTVGNISMLYDSQTWSPCPFVTNPDPLLRGLRLWGRLPDYILS